MIKVSRENSFDVILLAVIFFIPISEIVSIRLLLVAIVLSLVFVTNPKWRYELVNNGWDLIFYFSVLAFGLIYTEELSNGWSVLEKNLSFIALPLLFSRIKIFDKVTLYKICTVFIIGVLTASGICLGYAIWRDVFQNFPNGYYYDEFTAIIDSHPTYMAYYVCFSIIFLLFFLSYETNTKIQRVFIILGILFLSGILMLTAGRSTFVSMLMMSSFFFLKLLYEPSPLRKKIQGISVTILVLVILLFQSPFSQKMFPHFLAGRPFTLSMVKGDSWERLIFWESAMKANTNLAIGVGTGDYSKVMNEYYLAHQPELAEANFNAHNQFIQILFSNGVIGLMALLLIMIRPILLSARRQNILGMLTFFPFLIYGISEVFLGRFQGIIFFVLLHQIFTKYLNQNTKQFSMKNL
jgi:O-antigen ligase